MKKLSWIMILIFLLCDLTIGQTEEFQTVPAERIPDILNTISNHIHENFRRIHTLEGETEVSWYVVYKGETAKDIFVRNTDAIGEAPNSIMEIALSKTTFSCDLDKGFFYSKNHRTIPSRYIDPLSGKDLGTKSIPWYRISILTPEYYLQSMPNRMRDGHIVQRRVVKEKVDKDCSSCERPSVVDPRNLFNFRSPLWLQYPRILKRIREKGEYVVDEYALKVEELILPDIVQYRVHEPTKNRPHGNVWFINTFSSNAGYNMVAYEETRSDGRLMHKRSVEYKLIEGVYVPSKETKENLDAENSSQQYQKTRTFKNVRLNHSIPAETFTYNNLGLENGDEFVDKILGKEYTYQEGVLVEIKKNDK